MKLSRKELISVAIKLEFLAKIIRDKPDAISKAIATLAGEAVNEIDPLLLPPEQRYRMVNQAAEEIGITSEQLLDVYRFVKG